MPNYRVLLSFAKKSDGDLGDFTQVIIDSMGSNPAYPTPKVTMAELEAKLAQFVDAISKSDMGGSLETARKNVVRQQLLALLRKQAAYVQGEASDDLPKLLSSGFETVKRDRARTDLPAPAIERIRNERSTQLVLDLTPVPNARSYEVQKMNGAGTWLPAGIYSQARRIVVEGLTPGSNYTFQVRAVGGLSGYSGWSDPVSHMSL